MKLTREEMETIITFNEIDGAADIETFNSRIKRDIVKAAENYPQDVTVHDNGDGSIRAILPKKRVKIRAPQKLTEERRAQMAESARKNLLNN